MTALIVLWLGLSGSTDGVRPVEPGLSTVTLTGPAGPVATVAIEAAPGSPGTRASRAPARAAPRRRIHGRWRVAGSDGHATSEIFRLTAAAEVALALTPQPHATSGSSTLEPPRASSPGAIR